jgi:hypothetical protein
MARLEEPMATVGKEHRGLNAGPFELLAEEIRTMTR